MAVVRRDVVDEDLEGVRAHRFRREVHVERERLRRLRAGAVPARFGLEVPGVERLGDPFAQGLEPGGIVRVAQKRGEFAGERDVVCVERGARELRFFGEAFVVADAAHVDVVRRVGLDEIDPGLHARVLVFNQPALAVVLVELPQQHRMRRAPTDGTRPFAKSRVVYAHKRRGFRESAVGPDRIG